MYTKIKLTSRRRTAILCFDGAACTHARYYYGRNLCAFKTSLLPTERCKKKKKNVRARLYVALFSRPPRHPPPLVTERRRVLRVGGVT